MCNEHCLTSFTISDSVNIFGTKINVHVKEGSQGELNNLTESRISVETLTTGFLMWISSYCIACIYQQHTKVMQMFCPLSDI